MRLLTSNMFYYKMIYILAEKFWSVDDFLINKLETAVQLSMIIVVIIIVI